VSNLGRPLLQSVTRVVGALKLPVLVANPFNAHRQPLHAQNFPLVLLYTARAGSAALIKWFLFQTGYLDQATELHRGVHRLSRSAQLRHRDYGWQALRLIVTHEKPIFKLVRNPYDRAVSSFRSTVFHTREKQSNPWGRKIVTAARKYSGKPLTAELSFRDFLRFVAMNGTEIGLINGHVARQHVAGEDGFIDRIMKLECFAEEIRRIESEYGLAPSPLESIVGLRHEGSRLPEETNCMVCAADLEITSAYVRQGRFPPYEAFYDDETRRLVRDCYAADFEAYGYDT
jgi:Sulfotransferase family